MIANKRCDGGDGFSRYIQPRRAFSISGNTILEPYMNDDRFRRQSQKMGRMKAILKGCITVEYGYPVYFHLPRVPLTVTIHHPR